MLAWHGRDILHLPMSIFLYNIFIRASLRREKEGIAMGRWQAASQAWEMKDEKAMPFLLLTAGLQ